MPGIRTDFIQMGAQLPENLYVSDHLLKSYLAWKLPKEVLAEIEPDLVAFGRRCASDVFRMGEMAEANPPRHVPYSPWGRRVDRIEVSEAWLKLHGVSAEEGLIALGYERKHGALSRVHQFAKLYLFHASSAFYTCPLAMTDGAARVIELSGSDELKARALRHLTSRKPEEFWTSGQWMTERTGGSDVSGTSTVARKSGDQYLLYGDKWFTSATTSEMSLALAKVEGATDSREGLSLFFIELRDEAGGLRNIRINRLKDKLGTKALPTAELTLEGAPGIMIGDVGDGVKKVASLLNITRTYNSVSALSTMGRGVMLAKDYSLRRQAFGQNISDHPLHLQTIANLQAEFEGVFHLTFHLAHLLGKDETGTGTAEESTLLRLLTPVLKLWSAKQAIAAASEVIEVFGGAGYIEDTGLPRMLRDAQVYSIWEGTTNVLSLDTLRAIAKENAFAPCLNTVRKRVSSVKSDALKGSAEGLRNAAIALEDYFKQLSAAGSSAQQAGARALAMGLARVYAGSLLLEYADAMSARLTSAGATGSAETAARAVEMANRFMRNSAVNLPVADDLDSSRLGPLIFDRV